MQRTNYTALALTSLALAGAPLPGAAQSSNLTLYGIADLYLQYGHGGAGTTTSVQSGGVSSSRLGFKGQEDLGSGLRARFQLEMGINADTGSLAQGGLAFGRQAWVGLEQDGIGTLSLGRQEMPQYIVLDHFDPYGTGAGSAASSGIVSTTSRANNSVVLRSASWAGFTASALVGLGETGADNTRDNKYGLGLQYAAGAFEAGLALNQFKAADPSRVDAHYALLTASYDLGAFKVTGGIQRVENLGGDRAVDRREALLGVLVPVGRDTFSAGVGAGRTDDLAGSTAVQYTLGYSHPLSPRTRLYGIGTYINNGRATGYTADAATGTGPATLPGKDVSALQLGIRHAF